jgi:hypothetical protein
VKPVIAFLVLLAGVVLLTGTVAQAQSREDLLVRYLRTDIASKKTEVMSTGLLLPPEEAKAFSPVYQQYQQELAQLSNARQALITNIFAIHQVAILKLPLCWRIANIWAPRITESCR